MIFSATQTVPRFIQEITDVYVKKGDVALFECVYSGNPKPGKYHIWSKYKVYVLYNF